MQNNITMRSADAVSAKLAECFVTIDGKRYNFMQMIDLEVTVEKKKTNVPILGELMEGNKPAGMSGKIKGKMHFNQSVFRRILLEYKKTGKDLYFDMQIINEDPTSRVGRQTIDLIDCNLDSMTLAKFDAAGEILDEDFEGTFDNWNMPEEFELLEGMEA